MTTIGKTTARPSVSDAQLKILDDVAASFGPDGYTEAEGASQVGFNRRSLERLLAAGHLVRTDTSDVNTDGGRYRLHLTASGRDQLERAIAHRLVVRKTLGAYALWAVTRSFWWTAASAVVLALLSGHQGVQP